jgi:hypothetical protein
MFQLPKRRKSLGTKPGLYDGCLRHYHPNSYNKVTVSCPVWGLTMSCLERCHGPFLHTDSFKFHTVAQHISALTVVSHSTNFTRGSPTESHNMTAIILPAESDTSQASQYCYAAIRFKIFLGAKWCNQVMSSVTT